MSGQSQRNSRQLLISVPRCVLTPTSLPLVCILRVNSRAITWRWSSVYFHFFSVKVLLLRKRSRFMLLKKDFTIGLPVDQSLSTRARLVSLSPSICERQIDFKLHHTRKEQHPRQMVLFCDELTSLLQNQCFDGSLCCCQTFRTPLRNSFLLLLTVAWCGSSHDHDFFSPLIKRQFI